MFEKQNLVEVIKMTFPFHTRTTVQLSFSIHNFLSIKEVSRLNRIRSGMDASLTPVKAVFCDARLYFTVTKNPKPL